MVILIIVLIVIFSIAPKHPTSNNKSSNYQKTFPHIFTNDDSSDEDKMLDDLMFMDLVDDDDEW